MVIAFICIIILVLSQNIMGMYIIDKCIRYSTNWITYFCMGVTYISVCCGWFVIGRLIGMFLADQSLQTSLTGWTEEFSLAQSIFLSLGFLLLIFSLGKKNV